MRISAASAFSFLVRAVSARWVADSRSFTLWLGSFSTTSFSASYILPDCWSVFSCSDTVTDCLRHRCTFIGVSISSSSARALTRSWFSTRFSCSTSCRMSAVLASPRVSRLRCDRRLLISILSSRMSSSRSRYWFSPRSSAIFSMLSFSVSSEAECSSSVFMFSTTVFSVCFSFSTRSIVLFALNSSATLAAFSSFSWSTLRIAFFSRSFSPSDSLLQVVRSRSKMFRSPRLGDEVLPVQQVLVQLLDPIGQVLHLLCVAVPILLDLQQERLLLLRGSLLLSASSLKCFASSVLVASSASTSVCCVCRLSSWRLSRNASFDVSSSTLYSSFTFASESRHFCSSSSMYRRCVCSRRFSSSTSTNSRSRVLNFRLERLYRILVALGQLHRLCHPSRGSRHFVLHLGDPVLLFDELLTQILTRNEQFLKVFRQPILPVALGLDRFEHTPQNTPPQLRQWCLLRNGVKADAQAMHRGASQSGIHLGGSSGIRRCCSCGSFLDPLALCLRVPPPPPPPADAFPPSTTMHASLRLTLRSCAVRLPPTIPPPPAPPAPTGEEATTDTDTFTVTFRLSTLAVRRTGDESPDEPNTESCSGFASSAE
uniref:Uncharacterized protein n=1 Tax=Anopheles merus TaxID=30066 RepID=A0A182USB8_ANOME